MKKKTSKKQKKEHRKTFTSWYDFNKWLIGQDYNIAKPIFVTNTSGSVPETTITLR